MSTRAWNSAVAVFEWAARGIIGVAFGWVMYWSLFIILSAVSS